MLRSVKFLSRATLDLLYKLLVRSVIDYGLIIHFHSLRQTEVARLTQIQYRAAKLVTGALHLTSRDKLDAELGWENISTRAEFLGLSLFHKIHLHETRPLVRTCMSTLSANFQNTRAKGCYVTFPNLGNHFSKSFFPHFTKSWNNLERSLQSEPDLSVFKEKLKLNLKPKKYRHLARGSKLGNKLQTHLRVGRSFLHLHGFTIVLVCLKPQLACVIEWSQSIIIYLTAFFTLRSVERCSARSNN